MQDLASKTVLLTGASKGIGAAIAQSLGSAGARVVLHYGSDRAGAEQAAQGIDNDRKLLVQADFGQREAVEELWTTAQAWAGRIDVLINNAGVMLWDGGFDAPLADWDRVWEASFEINVMAPTRLMRRAVPHFLEYNGGTIITVSSWSAQRGATNPAHIAYAATKAATHAATQTIARAHAAQGILAHIVAPGVVHTRLSEQFAARPGWRRQSDRRIDDGGVGAALRSGGTGHLACRWPLSASERRHARHKRSELCALRRCRRVDSHITGEFYDA